MQSAFRLKGSAIFWVLFSVFEFLFLIMSWLTESKEGWQSRPPPPPLGAPCRLLLQIQGPASCLRVVGWRARAPQNCTYDSLSSFLILHISMYTWKIRCPFCLLFDLSVSEITLSAFSRHLLSLLNVRLLRFIRVDGTTAMPSRVCTHFPAGGNLGWMWFLVSVCKSFQDIYLGVEPVDHRVWASFTWKVMPVFSQSCWTNLSSH